MENTIQNNTFLKLDPDPSEKGDVQGEPEGDLKLNFNLKN